MITNIIFAVGFLLVVALVGAILSERIRVPKVTAYLLVGLAVGPHGAGLLRAEHVDSLEPFNDLAMALVLFNLGCQFPLDRFRSLLRRLVPISIGEQGACFLLVGIASGVATGSATIGLLLGIMAMATAPATTVLVLKEAQSRGPVTDLCGGLVAFNNLTCILVFELAYVGIQITGGGEVDSIASQLGGLFGGLAGAAAIGVISGLLVSFCCGLLANKRWLVLLLGSMALVLGACELSEVPYLLAFLMMGLTVVNTSPDAPAITKVLGQATTLLCVMFFVLHGTHLDIHAFVSAGVIGVLYILTRMLGKYVGVWIVANRRNEPDDVKNWLGPTLMAQAGVAIALSASIVERGVDNAREIQTIILGSVVFFEIVGPLLIRHAVYHAGEMPLGHAIHHSSMTPREQLDVMWNRFLVAIGNAPETPESPQELKVESLVSTDVQALPSAAELGDVIEHIEHSHDNVFPVVDAAGIPTGLIRYAAISGAVFDPDCTDVVCADDLAEPLVHSVEPSDSLESLVRLFNSVADDCVVVTDPDGNGRFHGVVRRSDVMNLLIRGHRQA